MTGSSRAGGPFTQFPDRRLLELDEALRNAESAGGTGHLYGLYRDSTRTAQLKQHALNRSGYFVRGIIVHALPNVNWYKVQLGDGGGWIAACMGSSGTLMPLGARDICMAGPNDNVLVYKPNGINYGFIICVIPPIITQGSVLCPDWLVQGGGSGLRREAGHQYPIANLYKGGGVFDWSAQRPLDQTPLDRGWSSPFGMCLLLDDFLVQLRASEMAGLWISLIDNFVRLAGYQLLLESSIHEEEAGDDEGESRYFKGVATYVHEALGQYANDQAWTETNTPADVQFKTHRGSVDLPTGKEDTQPIYRYREFGGYLGQGHFREVSKPAQQSGVQQFTVNGAGTYAEGLFRETIGLDGSLTLLSTKSLHIGKRCKIIVPKATQPHQSSLGDDARANNYKFSSLYGEAPPHLVGDVKLGDGTPQSMLRAATVMDFIAYDVNWKAIHPFQYHTADYNTPQESQTTNFSRIQENLEFGAAASGGYVPDPTPVQLHIDPRYGQVNYFMRESFIRFHDDGTVHLCGGAGEEIILGGGHIFLNTPASIAMRAGADCTLHAAQVILKAKDSVDISATQHDVRLKAERNLQILAGNSGTGGLLLESKGEGAEQFYENLFGEDVEASGIVLRTSNATAAILAQDIYLRSGGSDLGTGDILLDANQGQNRVQFVANEIQAYIQDSVTFAFGPNADDDTVTQIYYFGAETMIANVEVLVGGSIICYQGKSGPPDIITSGSIYAVGNVACAGIMADEYGMFLGQVPPGFAAEIQAACNVAAKAAPVVEQADSTLYDLTVVEKYYQANQLGNAELIQSLEFSFRDPPGGPVQYNTEEFSWPESRWQQFVRFGLGSGGVAWTEKPVIYQGQPTYPWPGMQKWVEEPSLLQLSALTMFNPGAGYDDDRPGPYESPTTGSFDPVPPDGNFKLLR